MPATRKVWRLLMNPQDRRKYDTEASEVGKAFSLSPAKGKPLDLSLQDWYGRFGWLRLVPPHPVPLPQGEGTPHPASFLSRASLPLASCALRFKAEANARPSALDSPRSGGRFSLSPRERAGVRGKGRDPVDQIHAQCFDGNPHLVPLP